MTIKPETVRPIGPGDEDKLYELLCMAYKENAPYSMSEQKVRHMIAEGARDKVVIIGVVDGADGKNELAGTIGAVFSQWWYTEDWHIEECWNFVHPDYRRFGDVTERKDATGRIHKVHSTHYANDLIDYMKWVSEQMSMPLHMGILTSTRLEAKTRLYKRKMPQVGAAFCHNMESSIGPIAKELVNG